MIEPLTIDVKMHGREGITATFVVRSEKVALVEAGPKSSADNVLKGLESAGIDQLDWIVVTHVHLDHAGAAGTLAHHFPEARVAVHPLGAPHLVDPSKLWSSAARIYGDSMEPLWGGIDPIAEGRVVALEDGDKIDLGGRSLQAIETPGHAYHHHAYLDDLTGIAFTGDALGVRLPDVGVVRPATPPPELDVEAVVESIHRIKELGPAALWLTHFGSHDGGARSRPVDAFCEEAIQALRKWEQWVRESRTATSDLEEVATLVREKVLGELERDLPEASLARMEGTTSYRMNTWGYMHYMDKQGQ